MDLSRAQWRKSSRSGTETNCVEVAFVQDRVATRDSKNPTGPVLLFDREAWAGFLQAVKAGAFDLD
ncbi:regulator [Carbonactinospora thermoautotrophica]|uniref:Regulator n=1 Tax=Carbonactinospora thermoautotrophica TaxID=1469144 RepID=A0A132N1T3_9ACTN|nr:DUF397 domain-containing protein [Carbonactinospora thermoautotrophica]KWW99506.1 putative regulator [Carbonactinospora thermoautotrophica]KWX04088.1 regulator [Carbonactinospora thermoautotrophica]KWX07813.1 regulator [Carbonactinospora thermoautotrophica]